MFELIILEFSKSWSFNYFEEYIINMCDPSVRPWSASEIAHHGLCTFAHYCQLILCRVRIELIQTIQFEDELTGTL